jgi:hypothetical protein
MPLSQAYLEWERQIERRGFERWQEQEREQERQEILLSLLKARYEAIDAELEAVIPSLMALSSKEWTRLIVQLSKAELIQHLAESMRLSSTRL